MAKKSYYEEKKTTEVKPKVKKQKEEKIVYECIRTCTFPKEKPVLGFIQGQKVTTLSIVEIVKDSKNFKRIK